MLYNKTKKQKIIEKTKIAQTYFEKFRGLMLEKKIDFALIFYLNKESILSASIHSMFMLKSIDVLFLNKQKKIIDLKENFRSWQLNLSPRKPAKYIVELPAGCIHKNKICLGNKIEWK